MRIVDLRLDSALGDQYKSATQKVRVITEAWTEINAFCSSCGGSLTRGRNNSRVLDFRCVRCQNEFELKSTRVAFSRKVPDCAYSSMMSRLTDSCSPDFLFLTYDKRALYVTNLFAVPTHFLDETVIEKRRPLSPGARRAGWVGCNIVMDRIPEAGKVFYVKNSTVLPKSHVIEAWRRTAFLREEKSLEARGWTLEILRIVQRLGVRDFTLKQVYEFEAELKERYPHNNFVREKMRQQLQVLRDAGLLTFQGRGHYRKLF